MSESAAETPTASSSLHRLFFPDLPAEDLPVVLEFCRERGLNPWARHVVARHQWDPLTRKTRLMVLVTIDGLRSRAAVTGAYCGNDAATFVEADGRPEIARATVHRLVGGEPRAYTAEARWSSYYPVDGDTVAWDKMPHTMLAKVAEAAALRKGFPDVLGGLYVVEEFDQATGRREERRPAVDDGNVGPTTTEGPAPETRRQLELRMLDLGFRTEQDRREVMGRLIAKWPTLWREQEDEFCRRAWRELSANATKYGASAPLAAAG